MNKLIGRIGKTIRKTENQLQPPAINSERRKRKHICEKLGITMKRYRALERMSKRYRNFQVQQLQKQEN